MTSTYPEKPKKHISWNIILDIFIYIQLDVEYKETAPAIVFSVFYGNSDMSAENEIIISKKPKKIYIVEFNSGHVYIYIKMVVEWNETTPAISFSLCHEDIDMLAEKNVRIYRETSKIYIVEYNSGHAYIHANGRWVR